jgi:hypothetical protein
MFEGFIKEIPKELVDNKYNLVQRAWDEAIRTNAHLITSEPIICVPREPMYPDNYDYFYYKRELYKVRKSISIDSANVKRNNAYRANVNSALNILIARDCKTDEEKKARIYSELINLAIDYRRPRSGNSFPVYKDQNNNLVPYECYKNANEFADSLYIKHNPVMQYVWDVATGKPIVDFNNLPLKIKLAIPTKFVTASPALNQKEINSIGITNNSTPRRIAIAIFSAFIIVLLPVLSHNHGMDIASHQVDFVTFYTLEDGGPYIAYRIYDSHVICTTIGVSRLDRTISVFTKASMKYIQIKAIGPLIY